MKTLARLLAAHLLEAEPEAVPPESENNPAQPEADRIDVRDFILSSDTVLFGIPEPNFYADWQAKLGRRDKLKLETNTFLVKQPDGSISLRLHTTDIIAVNPQGIATVTTFGRPNPKHEIVRHYYGYTAPGFGKAPRSWKSVVTKERLCKYLPCEWNIFSEGGIRNQGKVGQGEWYWANSASRSGYFDGPPFRIVYTDGDQIDTNTGALQPQQKPVPVKAKSKEPRRGWAW